jgi:hypothetical protein
LSDIFSNENTKSKKTTDEANSFFLDNTTGDLYKYRVENGEWTYSGTPIIKATSECTSDGPQA